MGDYQAWSLMPSTSLKKWNLKVLKYNLKRNKILSDSMLWVKLLNLGNWTCQRIYYSSLKWQLSGKFHGKRKKLWWWSMFLILIRKKLSTILPGISLNKRSKIKLRLWTPKLCSLSFFKNLARKKKVIKLKIVGSLLWSRVDRVSSLMIVKELFKKLVFLSSQRTKHSLATSSGFNSDKFKMIY